MNIRDKWSSLFHDFLQNEDRMDKETADQALVLIDWMADKYEKYHREQGYVVPEEPLKDKKIVCDALQSKKIGLHCRQNWPTDIFNKWRSEKPFHESVGSSNLDSDWNSFWEAVRSKDDKDHGVEP